jgi:hypothetical protein
LRVVHYSIQRDHVHLLVEGDDSVALSNGMKSICSRIGKLASRVFKRSGSALDGRYHACAVRTPLEARRALAYVLLNARRHWTKQHRKPPPPVLDNASSAVWFDGWTYPTQPPTRPMEVATPRTWLLRVGWHRYGRIDLAEIPR